MAVGRRGIVFTLMAIVLVTLLIVGSRLLSAPLSPQQADTKAAQSRVGVIDTFTRTLEQHAAQSLRTAAYFALQNISRKIEADGAFVGSINSTLQACLLNNTLRMGSADMPCLPSKYLLNVSMERLTDMASSELGVSADYKFTGVWVTEELPMEVIVWANMSYNVSDSFASWQRSKVVFAVIDTEGIEDPVFAYLNGTGRTQERRMLRLTATPISKFGSATFGAFYANGSYIPYEGRAPSVLQRYEGKVSATSPCCGIESVMNRSSLTNVQARYVNFSMVDHHFASHLAGIISPYNCTALQVKSMSVAGGTLVLEARRFDSTYNLTSALAACAWS